VNGCFTTRKEYSVRPHDSSGWGSQHRHARFCQFFWVYILGLRFVVKNPAKKVLFSGGDYVISGTYLSWHSQNK
jgi:hypothetical protein